MLCSRFVGRWQILRLLTQRFSRRFAGGTLERRKRGRKRGGFQTLSIALICSLVSVEGFNFPGTTKSVFLFRRFSRQHRAGGIQKRVDSNTPTKSTCRYDAPPLPLMLRASIFFSALPLRHRLCLPFFFFVTRLDCRGLFEWAIVSRRSDCSDGTSLPRKKKSEPDGERGDRWLIVLLVTCDSSVEGTGEEVRKRRLDSPRVEFI